MQSFKVIKFGCQMNTVDSERLNVVLQRRGYIQDHENPDIIMFITCSVREKSVHKLFSHIGEIIADARKNKKDKPPIIGIGGCVSQIEGKEVFKRNNLIDFIFGTDTIDEVPLLLERVNKGEKKILALERSDDIPPETLWSGGDVSAYITVMKGCENFCSYCIVPFARGPEISKTISEVRADVVNLVASGAKEICLLGQNVNSFGTKNGESFGGLLRELNTVKGLHRIRFATSHPKDLNEDLCKAMAECSKVMPHLHVPAQSGSNEVLHKMNRKYTREDYLAKIKMLKSYVPHVSLTSDFIVGFPTETDENFEETITLIEEVKFDFTFSFMYSPRPGTKALDYGDTIPAKVKHDRLMKLHKVQETVSLELNSKFIGREVEVLIEKKSKLGGENNFTGRTPCNRLVHFFGDDSMVGDVKRVLVKEASGLSLKGVLI